MTGKAEALPHSYVSSLCIHWGQWFLGVVCAPGSVSHANQTESCLQASCSQSVEPGVLGEGGHGAGGSLALHHGSVLSATSRSRKYILPGALPTKVLTTSELSLATRDVLRTGKDLGWINVPSTQGPAIYQARAC